MGGEVGSADLKFQADIDEIRPSFAGRTGSDALEWSLNSLGGSVTPATPLGGGVDVSPSLIQQESDLNGGVASDQTVENAWYADQVPPFDITLAAANEYGDIATMGIFGCEFLNEGWGISIDDLVSEKQYTYLARLVSWWQWLQNPHQRLLHRSA
jgi:hypothetical protein